MNNQFNNFTDEERLENLDKANSFRESGGMLTWLVYNLPGFRDFVYQQFFEDLVPSYVFLRNLKAKYRRLDDYYIPSLTTVKKFRKEMRKLYFKEIYDFNSRPVPYYWKMFKEADAVKDEPANVSH